MMRLWMRISYESQVLEPSPFGVFLVVILRCLVGILTGPLNLASGLFGELRDLALAMMSEATIINEKNVSTICQNHLWKNRNRDCDHSKLSNVVKFLFSRVVVVYI